MLITRIQNFLCQQELWILAQHILMSKFHSNFKKTNCLNILLETTIIVILSNREPHCFYHLLSVDLFWVELKFLRLCLSVLACDFRFFASLCENCLHYIIIKGSLIKLLLVKSSINQCQSSEKLEYVCVITYGYN